MAEIATLPLWKKGATAYERLSELALLAKEHPERFEQFVIVYRETSPGPAWRYKTIDFGCNLNDLIGLLAIGQFQAYEDSKK